MSTRCQIQIEDNPVLFYIHHDGYPSGILPTLVPFVDAFLTGRGNDNEYMMAQLLFEFGRARGHAGSFTGFGLSTILHSDLSFFYLVRSDGTVEVYDDLPTGSAKMRIARGQAGYPGVVTH